MGILRALQGPTLVRGSSALSAAALMLGLDPDGLAFDFTAQSAMIRDTTTSGNNIASDGIVSDGALVGPGAKLTYTAPSPKLCRQSDGMYRYGAHNLCLQSEDISNAVWTGAALTKSGTDTFLETVANSGHNAFQLISGLVPGISYQLTVDISGVGRTWVAVGLQHATTAAKFFNLSGAGSVGGTFVSAPDAQNITYLGNGKYRIDVTVTVTNASAYVVVYSATSDGVYAFAGDTSKGFTVNRVHVRRSCTNPDYIKTTTTALYALPYEWDASGNYLGILPELAGTNFCWSNRDLSTAQWTKRGTTTATKTATGIDGAANSATAIRGVGLAGVNDVYDTNYSATSRTTANVAVVFSFFIKKVSTTGTLIVYNAATGIAWNINLSLVGTGWQRITPDHPAVTISVALVASASGQFGIGFAAASGTLDFDVDFLQYETTPVSSPILTAPTASVTRLVDQISIADTLFPTSTTGFLLFAQFIARNIAANRYICYGNPGQSAYFEIVHNSSQQVRGGTDPTTGMFMNNFNTYTSGTVKSAISVKLNEGRQAVNGVNLTPDTVCTVPNPDALYITGRLANFGTMHSHIQKVMLLPRAAVDQAEVNALTV